MNTVEVTPVATEALPIAGFRDHLRLGTGFGQDSLQDGVLEASLRAALGRVEGYCGKAVLSHGYVSRVSCWRDLSRQILPRAPVSAVTQMTITDRLGVETVVDAGAYRLIRDDHTPLLISAGYMLPRIPLAGQAAIYFDAGYTDWTSVPNDMAQAVLMLAAQYYEGRNGGPDCEISNAVSGLLSRFRPLRLLGGGRS